MARFGQKGGAAGEIGVDRADQVVEGRRLLLVDDFADRRQRVDRGGESGSVNAEIVILSAGRKVASRRDRAAAERRGERAGEHVDFGEALFDPVGFGEQPFAHQVEKRGKIGRVFRFGRTERRVDRRGERDRGDVRNVHADPRNDELPARGDRVVTRVFE